jgi:dihydroorotase
VVPGLIDLHTHVGFGATTEGVGMGGCDPDAIGVHAGVTTVADGGSVGVANLGVFPAHILPKARTRVITFVNAGSYAHTMPGPADVNSLDDINRDALQKAAEHNPGLIGGVKLRIVGPVFADLGEDVITKAKAAATDLGVPLMVHIGDFTARDQAAAARRGELTRFLLKTFEAGDILTHLCTPNAGRVLDPSGQPYPEVAEARARGVVLDSALGRGNFGIEVARRQADLGLYPDTISSDLTAMGQTFHSLLECMAKFMSIGYSLADVVTATTASAARVLGKAGEIGAIAVGRDADLTILDVAEGDFTFTDTTGQAFRGNYGLAPVYTLKAGEGFSPGWGTHPWGWLPASA